MFAPFAATATTATTAIGFTVTLAVAPTTVAPRPTTPTTTPGALITVDGGPSATANIPGPHSDSADFYGIFLALFIIVAAIAITRVVFGWRPGSRRASPSSGSDPSTAPSGTEEAAPSRRPPPGGARTPESQ